ncbi:neuroglian-like [Physella acuta]|uniref:neuroglian-like n=1 Tax=Physella acuta TaxID=109671 RepID=UPI0027DE7727|nr:neuroglian-like [Physella acuta]
MSVTGQLWHLAVVCWTLQVGLGEVSHSPELTPPYITCPTSQARVIIRLSQISMYGLHCQANGRPTPIYSWYINGLQVDNTNPSLHVLTNGTLVMRNFTQQYDGVYQCRAGNKFGTSVSVKFQVLVEKEAVKFPNSEESEVESIPIEAEEGQPLSVTCGQTPQTVPEYIRRWYRYTGSSELVMGERVGTDLNGTLHFAYVERQDGDTSSRQIRCGLAPNGSSSSTIYMYSSYSITVKVANTGDSLPRLIHSSTNVKGHLGDRVTLECFFSGRPVPKVTWTDNKNNGIHGNQRFQLQDFNRKLVITEVRQEDEGYFMCTGTNSMGYAQTEIYFNVTSAPMRESSFGPLTYPTEHDVTLNCTARAAIQEKLDNPVWYRNGELFIEENFPDVYRYRFNEDRTRLSIKNLNKSVDTACYQCNISNSEGYIFYDGYIRVIDSIKIQTRPPEIINLVEAPNNLDLTVIATSDPCCPLTRIWQFNGSQVTGLFEQHPFYDYGSSTGTLFINKSLVSRDQLMDVVGHYRLSLYNRYQTVDVTFSLTLEDGVAEGFIVAVVDYNLWWVGLLCGVLAIICALVVVIFIVKNNFPRRTYQLEKAEIKQNLDPKADLREQRFKDI